MVPCNLVERMFPENTVLLGQPVGNTSYRLLLRRSERFVVETLQLDTDRVRVDVMRPPVGVPTVRVTMGIVRRTCVPGYILQLTGKDYLPALQDA